MKAYHIDLIVYRNDGKDLVVDDIGPIMEVQLVCSESHVANGMRVAGSSQVIIVPEPPELNNVESASFEIAKIQGHGIHEFVEKTGHWKKHKE